MTALSASPAPAASRPRGARAPGSRPRLRVVAPPRRTGRWVLLLAAVAAAGVLGVVSLSALAAEQAFAARSLKAEVTELRHRYEDLTAEVARLESPARVRAVAEAELGMVPAEQPAYVVVERTDPTVPVSHAGGEPAPLADPLKAALGAGN